MGLKPCTNCGEECEIFPIQLGDQFTLTYLRVCDYKCLFETAYEFLYSLSDHKNFRNFLLDLENEEDKADRKVYLEELQKEQLSKISEKLNSDLLKAQLPIELFKSFKNAEPIEKHSKTLKFCRIPEEELIRLQKEFIEAQRKKLKEAERDLEDMLKIGD